MKTFRQNRVLFTAQAAMTAAIYVVLTVIGASFSFGPIQVRISEALTILPAFTPAGIPGVFLGCLISNMVTGALLPEQEQIPGSGASDSCERGYRAVCPEICLYGASSDPFHDADGRVRRGDLLRCTGHAPLYRTESV